jgi:hypothetical protein
MPTLLAFAAALALAVTGSATDVTRTTATLQGTVDPQGEATTYSFEYGTSEAYGLQTPATAAGDGTEPVPVRAAVTGLTPNTTYHYRLVATNASGTVRGEDATFRTAPNPPPPDVSGQRARVDGPSAATVTAAVDANGSPTTIFVEYGPTSRLGSRTPLQPAGAGADPVPVAVALGGLAPHTRYHYRLVATNAAGTDRGARRRFTTSRLPTGVSLSLSPRIATWGTAVTLGGRVTGAGAARTPLALEALRFPYQSGWSEIARTRAGGDGGYLFRVPTQWTTTRYRVVTRTRVVATSPVAEGLSAVRVGRIARHRSRRWARIEGSVLPAVSGRVSLHRLTRRGWRLVRRKALSPTDAQRSRYLFAVRRKRHVRRFRVVAVPEAGGAYMRGRSATVKVRPRP